MRRAFAALGLLSLLLLAGCTSPFTPYPTSNLPEVRATFDPPVAYDSDGNGQTDGIRLRLRSAQPPPPLVGSDVVIERNGDSNVTVWRCAEREELRCGEGNRGILSWDVGEDIFIRGLPGPNRLNLIVRERFVYNTTLRVEETRDTEVWAALSARTYDSNGNRTADGIEVFLINSDKAPFPASEVRVLINQVEQPLFGDPPRLRDFGGPWRPGQRVFVDGFIGDNRLTVFIQSTRYDLGTYVLGE